MERKHITLERALPEGMPSLPFSDAVLCGETLYIAGRIGLDRKTFRPPAGPEDEARLLMDDLKDVLAGAHMTLADLVMVTIFSPDVTLFGTFNAVYLSYFEGTLPARAFIGSGPLLFGARFELTATAVRG